MQLKKTVKSRRYHAGVEMEGFTCGIEVILIWCPLAPLKTRSEFDRAATIHVIDTVDAGHQAAQFAMVIGVKEIKLYGGTSLNVKGHNACLTITEAVLPNEIQCIECLPYYGHRIT